MFSILTCLMAVHTAQADDVIDFVDGENMVSFRVLPEDPTLKETLGAVWGSVVSIRTDGEVAVRFGDGTWAGNLVHFSRVKSYDIDLSLKAETSLRLKGRETDPDIRYNLRNLNHRASFPCKEAVDIKDVLANAPVGTIREITSQYGTATVDVDEWTGDFDELTPNYGYNFTLSDSLRGFSYVCPEIDGVDPYTYGCTDPFASNLDEAAEIDDCLLYTSPSPRDLSTSRMPSSA